MIGLGDVICALFSLLLIACTVHAQTPDHDLSRYGGNTLDDQPDDDALERAVAGARAGGSSRITWRGALILTRPPPNLTGLILDGGNMLGSSVRKRYPGGVLFNIGAPAQANAGITALKNFSVPQDVGTPNSYTILARATSTWAPDCLVLENLYLGIGSGPGPFRSIELSGLARVSPAGIRQARIHNVTVFGSSAAANVCFVGTVDLFVTALRVYPAGGTWGDVFWGPGNTGQVVY